MDFLSFALVQIKPRTVLVVSKKGSVILGSDGTSFMCIWTYQQKFFDWLLHIAILASSAAFIFLVRNKIIMLRECFSTELGLDFEVVSRNIKMLEKVLFL